jgi:hypothetical protein
LALSRPRFGADITRRDYCFSNLTDEVEFGRPFRPAFTSTTSEEFGVDRVSEAFHIRLLSMRLIDDEVMGSQRWPQDSLRRRRTPKHPRDRWPRFARLTKPYDRTQNETTVGEVKRIQR